MWAQILQNRFLYIILLILAAIAGIYFWGRSSGKRKAGGTQAKLPDSGMGIPKNWNPAPVVEQIHSALKGLLTPTLNKQLAFQSLLALTGDQLTAVYNEFNRRYQGGQKGDTLTQWIRDEWFTSSFHTDLKDKLIEKLVSLGLK